MQHFHQNPLSFLCVTEPLSEIHLDSHQLEYLRTLPSLPDSAKNMSDSELKKALQTWLQDFRDYTNNYPYYFQCFLKLTSFYPAGDEFQTYLTLQRCDPSQFAVIASSVRFVYFQQVIKNVNHPFLFFSFRRSLPPDQLEQLLKEWYAVFHKRKIFADWEKEVTLLLEKFTLIQLQAFQPPPEEKPTPQQDPQATNKKLSAKRRREFDLF